MATIPRFILGHDADNEKSETFLLHTQKPRFLASPGIQGDEAVLEILQWIDPVADFSDPGIRQLMHDASAYLRRAVDE